MESQVRELSCVEKTKRNPVWVKPLSVLPFVGDGSRRVVVFSRESIILFGICLSLTLEYVCKE